MEDQGVLGSTILDVKNATGWPASKAADYVMTRRADEVQALIKSIQPSKNGSAA